MEDWRDKMNNEIEQCINCDNKECPLNSPSETTKNG